MSTLVLKLIACGTMLIDHTAYVLAFTGRMEGYHALYVLLRLIGRVAFPIFGFQIVQGAMYTRNKVRYALRLLIFGLISEAPFDLAFSGTFWDPTYQNVYFTLVLGLLCVYVIQWGSRLPGKKVWLGWGAAFFCTMVLGALAEFLLLTDYGFAGVLMIAVMGVLAAPMGKVRYLVRSEYFFQMFVSAFAIALLVLFTNSAELTALLALVPIYFYNGQQKLKTRLGRILVYIYYPLHLTILGLIFVWPKISSLYIK